MFNQCVSDLNVEKEFTQKCSWMGCLAIEGHQDLKRGIGPNLGSTAFTWGRRKKRSVRQNRRQTVSPCAARTRRKVCRRAASENQRGLEAREKRQQRRRRQKNSRRKSNRRAPFNQIRRETRRGTLSNGSPESKVIVRAEQKSGCGS